MDYRMFLAIALSMLVLVGFYAVFPPPAPEAPPPERSATGEQADGRQPATTDQERRRGEDTATNGTGEGGSIEQAAVSERSGSTQSAQPQAPRGELIAVETPRYMARIDTQGGKLASLRLKHHLVDKKHTDLRDVLPFLEQFFPKEEVDETVRVEMVQDEVPGADVFGVQFLGEDSLTRTFANVIFTPDTEALTVNGDSGELVLTGEGPDGLTLVKTYTFEPDSYIVRYRLDVINYGQAPRRLRIVNFFGEGPQNPQPEVFYAGYFGPIWRADGSRETEDHDDIEGQLIVREPEWLGIATTYFVTAARPETQYAYGLYRNQQLPDERWVSYYGVELPEVQLQPGKMISSRSSMYLGPKQEHEMAKFGHKLTEALDLRLDTLAHPLLALMRWLHSYVGNYGVAIILLTMIVRLVLFPLTYKGMVNIKRMQKVQPKFAALREKHKDNKEQLNKEMMELYKKHKMNPLGGCLPILLQIPIFIALYGAIVGAIELRHEPFILWLNDLSAKDGLYILPLLMGISLFVQMRLSPSSPDPMQRRIMQWMPVVFTAFMINFPSGLVLYWFTSNVLSIGQQLIINRVHIPEPAD